MGAVAGKDASFKLDTGAGALTDLSAYVDTSDLDRSIAMLETTCIGSTGDAKTYIVGLSDAKVAIAGPWDSALDAHLAGCVGVASLSCEYGPAGGTAAPTTPVYKFECLLEAYKSNSPVAGRSGISGSLQVSGVITRAVA
jgi:hypothetical protein